MTVKKALWGASLVVFVFLVWLGIRQYRRVQCRLRDEAFRQRVEMLKNDARDQLRIGANKTDVERFFRSHHMESAFDSGQAMGRMNTTGCARIGCGLDKAVIGLSVKVDSEGAVIAEPHVLGVYADCM